MNIRCSCGNVMSDVGAPNDTEHLLISNHSMEHLQDMVDAQVETDGIIDEWPEHWERSNTKVVWKCTACERLYLDPEGPVDQVRVYAIEKIGI